jgi:hypothetical protein
LATGAAVVEGAGATVAAGIVTATVVTVVSSVDGTADTTRLEPDEELADSDALLEDEPWTMSSTNSGKHARVTTRAMSSRRCVG